LILAQMRILVGEEGSPKVGNQAGSLIAWRVDKGKT